MKRTAKIGILAATALAITIGLSPMSARADSLQTDKNNMRNLAFLGGAAALYGLTNHNSGIALLGAAGAALAGSQYEKDRHRQSQQQDYYRSGYYGGYGSGSYNGDGYAHRYYGARHHWDNGNRDDRYGRGGDWGNRGRGRDRGGDRHDRGRHNDGGDRHNDGGHDRGQSR